VIRRGAMQPMLNSSAQPGLIKLAKLNKRLATTLILCLLGVAILSNRFFSLRQFTVRLNQNVSFQLPVDSATPAQPDRKAFLIAVPNESVSDLQQLARDIEIRPNPASTFRDSRVPSRFQTVPSSRLPSYILQSALNL
jgi:hypothetical protein